MRCSVITNIYGKIEDLLGSDKKQGSFVIISTSAYLNQLNMFVRWFV
ncbi:MAG: hypothetical protein WC313_00865 [Candidatus Kapaibacterium sp.]